MGHQLITLLDELAELVAATDDGPRLPVLRAVVVDLEELAKAPLGDVDGEPAAVLHRRFARAHRLLLRTHDAATARRLEPLIDGLRPPATPADGPRPAGGGGAVAAAPARRLRGLAWRTAPSADLR